MKEGPAQDSNQRVEMPIGYQIGMLALSVYALGALAFDWLAPSGSETVKVIAYADTVICAVFFVDFLISLWTAKDRWKYFRTWGWLDLASSLPLDAARFGRLARIIRVVRVFRALRMTRTMFARLLEKRAQNTALAAGIAALLLLIGASVGALIFEAGPEGNIKTAPDAVWWAITTMTTVGYGDHFPVTTGGRLIAAVLMIAGIGLFGVLSGLLASWFVAPEKSASKDEIAALREEIAALRERLSRDR